MLARFSQRSPELEHLDKGDYTAEEYEGCLIELRRINNLLGDARALRKSLLRATKESDDAFVSALDVGAGSGELLRVAAQHLRDGGRRRVSLVGLEYNARSARSILEESKTYDEVTSVRGDALRLPFGDDAFDYVFCSLLTHHFRDRQVIDILREMARVARRRLYVIDLHRRAIPYIFYTTVGRLFLRNRLVREDGALSILRSFRPGELEELAAAADLREVRVDRVFPYRLVLSGRKK